jgi:PIN domain nuclease of toxin-antitoxin system
VALLLDTHAFLWWVDDAPRLTKRARAAIRRPDQACFVSLASCWEIAIKVSLGKLTIESSLERFLAEQMAANGFQPLLITLGHVARFAALPFHHRDPFDRLLVAQAIDEDLTIVSADPVFQKYGVRRVW